MPANKCNRSTSRASMSGVRDRKSTRLNSSHRCISYAVFCLKKKKKMTTSCTHLNTTTSKNHLLFLFHDSDNTAGRRPSTTPNVRVKHLTIHHNTISACLYTC